MNIRKKTGSIVLLLSFFMIIFTGCSKDASKNNQTQEDDTLTIVTTTFPQYDWVRQIMGEDSAIENSYLLDSGIDLHSFQPTAADINAILSSDLFIYVGGESDEWVEDILSQESAKDLKTVNLMEVLGDTLKEEEIVEGMEEEETDEEEETEYDEHIWLSLQNASVLCKYLADTLSELDPERESIYQENVSSYIEALDNLDNEYQEAVSSAENDTIVVGDRFPFRYLVDDYGLDYYAAFAGCSAETEASFETIVFLAGKMDENNLSTILVTETSDQKIAETILQNTNANNQKILVLNSMQSVTKKEAELKTYLGTMQSNLDILQEALET